MSTLKKPFFWFVAYLFFFIIVWLFQGRRDWLGFVGWLMGGALAYGIYYKVYPAPRDKNEFVTEVERLLKTIVFQIILMFLAFFLITSTNGLTGKGIVLVLLLEMLREQTEEFRRGGLWEHWYWALNPKTKKYEKAYIIIVWVIFLFLNLGMK